MTETAPETPLDLDVHRHINAAVARSAMARAEAARLLAAGFPGPSLVWSVRAAELLVRDFILTPHYIEEGDSWQQAMRRGSKLLGSSNWAKALRSAEEWYGPFDEPLTEDGSNAWAYWTDYIVRRRGDLVHGRAVPDPTMEEAEEALAFTERMASWFGQRFLISPKHPMGKRIREILDQGIEEIHTPHRQEPE